jgi:DNA-binding FadR family transcriptional regulator
VSVSNRTIPDSTVTEGAPAGARAPASALTQETASDKATRFLRSQIYTGELRPGDRLPPERELASQLGISRVTLRLALKLLEGAGYIVSARGGGAGWRVSSLSVLLDCWARWARKNLDEVEDIFELRTLVETRIAWLAAERRTADEQAQIEATDALFRATRATLFRWDVAFHDALARASHSRRLEEVMIDVRGQLFLPVDQSLYEHRVEDVHTHHKAIIAAVSMKDAPAAAEAMRAHIADTRAMVYHALEASHPADRPAEER